MHPAPEITVLKALGGKSGSDLIQPGCVEVISFFFLRCAPCMHELSDLNALQKRYGKGKLQVTGVTTYKVNSYLSASTHSNIEAFLEKARVKNAPGIGVVMTPDETLASYGVNGFPVVDKMGRLRYVGHDINFEDDGFHRILDLQTNRRIIPTCPVAKYLRSLHF
jgi:hypothetical protein